MTARPSNILIRDARLSDAPTIVEFNQRLAFETEHKKLDPETLRQGVDRALVDPDRLRYWVAEQTDAAEPSLIGQTAITREWSDWRNGWIWWLQSVYVRQEYRGLGVFKRLYRHIHSLAREDETVIGLRLYYENDNHQALKTYEALGMKTGNYSVLEDLWISGL